MNILFYNAVNDGPRYRTQFNRFIDEHRNAAAIRDGIIKLQINK